MIIEDTQLSGVKKIISTPIEDERGYFSRTWCKNTLAQWGLENEIVQCSQSFNRTKHTLRGMHFQISPYAEAKYIQCLKGEVLDVIVNIDKDDTEYRRWQSFKLEENDHTTLYVGKSYAHGFLTLLDNSILEYKMTVPFHSDYSRGFHYKDPAVGIEWPVSTPQIISQKDQNLPLLEQS